MGSDGLKLNIGIAGAGIGGLAVAVAVARLGHNVSVYEAASQLEQIGAGIQVTPNASKQLLRWGVGEYLSDLRNNTPCFKIRRWKDGEIIGRMTTEQHSKQYGGPYVQVHRADLQQSLKAVAEAHGVSIYTGSQVVDYDFDEPALVLHDGQRIVKDLIFAADGIKSVAREKLTQSSGSATIPTGVAVFRSALDAALIANDDQLSHLLEEPGLNLWIGPQRHAVAYAMRGDSQINLVLEYPEPKQPSEWDESSYITDIQDLFKDWDPSLKRMLSMITKAMKWPLTFSVPLERWASDSGKFSLVGDAAHVVPSFLAQGAAMAIEDAATLEQLLSPLQSRDQIPEALREFEQTRMKRKAKVQELSLHNLHLYHLEDGDEQATRDGLKKGDESLNPIWTNVKDQQWLYGHDIEAK